MINFGFMVGGVHDFFLAATSDFLDASVVAWQPCGNNTTSASYCAWPINGPAHNPP